MADLPILGMRPDGSGAEADPVAAPLLPLKLYITGCATEQEMNANVTATIERGYVRFNEYLNIELGRKVHLCGSGPSFRETWKEIPAGDDILAINSAIGFLIEHGRPPKYAMIWDAAEICEKFATPHPDVTYLIGARCHPKVFERLKGCKVVVWHAGGDHNILEYLREHGIEEPLVNGGTAGVTRSLYLAYAIGYREIHVHGADSSYSATGDTHIRGSLVPEKDMQIFVGGKWFRTTPEWCAQVEEIKLIYPIFGMPSMGAKVEVYGEGMFQHVVRIMKSDEARALEVARYTLQNAINGKSIHESEVQSQPLEANT